MEETASAFAAIVDGESQWKQCCAPDTLTKKARMPAGETPASSHPIVVFIPVWNTLSITNEISRDMFFVAVVRITGNKMIETEFGWHARIQPRFHTTGDNFGYLGLEKVPWQFLHQI
jgi:hypothetical protein